LSPRPPQIEYISGGTPLTHQHYIASPKGEIYGVDHTIARLQAEAIVAVRAQTAVPNLYLTGTVATTQPPRSQTRTPPGKLGRGEKNLRSFKEIRAMG